MNQLTVQETIDRGALPPEWEPIVMMELLTGCSACERRVCDGDVVEVGTVILTALEPNGYDVAASYVLCKECDHARGA